MLVRIAMRIVIYLLGFFFLGTSTHLLAFEQLTFAEHDFTIQIPNNTTDQRLNNGRVLFLAGTESGFLSINAVPNASLALNDPNALADYKNGFELSTGFHVENTWMENVNGQQFFVMTFNKGNQDGVRYTINNSKELLILTYTKTHDKHPPDCDKDGIVFFQSFRFIKPHSN